MSKVTSLAHGTYLRHRDDELDGVKRNRRKLARYVLHHHQNPQQLRFVTLDEFVICVLEATKERERVTIERTVRYKQRQAYPEHIKSIQPGWQ